MTKTPPVKIVVTGLSDDALWTTTKLRPGDTVASVGKPPTTPQHGEEAAPDATALLKLLSTSPLPFEALFVKPPMLDGYSSDSSGIVTHGPDGRALSWLDRLPAKKGRPGDRPLNPRFEKAKQLFPHDKWVFYNPSPKSRLAEQTTKNEEEILDLNSYLNNNPEAEHRTSIIKSAPPVRKESNAEDLLLPLPMRPGESSSYSSSEDGSDVFPVEVFERDGPEAPLLQPAKEKPAANLLPQPVSSYVVTVDDDETANEHSFATVQTLSIIQYQSDPTGEEGDQVPTSSPRSRGDEIEENVDFEDNEHEALGTYVPEVVSPEHSLSTQNVSNTNEHSLSYQDLRRHSGGREESPPSITTGLRPALEPVTEVDEPPESPIRRTPHAGDGGASLSGLRRTTPKVEGPTPKPGEPPRIDFRRQASSTYGSAGEGERQELDKNVESLI